jgi:excisionase family DNA binding protein
MLNIINHEKDLFSSSILVMSSSDLESVVRGILEEVVAASNDRKDETLLSVSQAAALLNVNRSTLWSWEKKGYLKPVRIGRKVLYPMYALEAIRKGGEHGSL